MGTLGVIIIICLYASIPYFVWQIGKDMEDQ